MQNIASSFRLRNKLKGKIANLLSSIECANFNKTAGTVENTSPCDGKTLSEAINEFDTLMELICELNTKIDKANIVNKDSLISMETLKVRIAFYEKLVEKCRRNKEYEIEYDENGERIKVYKEPIVDQKQIISTLASLKKEKDALEEKINTVNFNTVVDFNQEKILSRL